ncbi:hypothetical protein H5410_031040 [Solanum commersonii]|uniref:Uncharacterized protein n=1 Tax=Solanum commersonii TaxID=4109 RepID=A0A9J5YL45_SOLCO|nr:hypothetical protein H5410_031040 [Solanum commersonii]
MSIGAAFLFISGNSSALAELRDQYKKWQGSLLLLGPRGHLLPNKKPQVNAPLGQDRSKISCLSMTQNGLVLGLHYGVVDKAKLETSSNIQVLFFNRDSSLNPPRGGIRNQRSQLAL